MVKLTKKTYIYIYIQSLSLSRLYLFAFLFRHGSYSFDAPTSSSPPSQCIIISLLASGSGELKILFN